MRSIAIPVMVFLLVTMMPVQAAADGPLGEKAAIPRPDWGEKLGNVVGDLVDEFEAGGGLNRIVWSAEKQERFCEAQALRFVDMPEEKRAGVAGIVIKNCEISIRTYEQENTDGKNNRNIAGGYVRLAGLYSYAGPEYAANRLDALDNAIKADPYWSFGWEQKADMLEEYGLHSEAQAVLDERDRLYAEQLQTGAGLFDLFGIGMPLSAVPAMGALLVVLFLVRGRIRK